jgi:uncharacterized membrane protein
MLVLGEPLPAALWAAALAAAVGAQWTALAVGNGLSSPALVLGAVGVGSIASVLGGTVLVAVAGLGAPGYLFGLIFGQTVTLVILLTGILRALPEGSDEAARLWPAFRDYSSLAAAGLLFNASLWVDKLIAWWLVGGREATLHTTASTIAWFSTIPCLAWVFVAIETRFHRRFRGFYRRLEGGAPLEELRDGVRSLGSEALRLLRGAVSVQATVTLFLQFAADPWIHRLGLPDDAMMSYRVLLIGAGTQAVALLGLILLYYFDLRRAACVAAAALFASVAVGTLAASMIGVAPSVGTTIGAAAGGAFIWMCVVRGVSAILPYTLLGQPYLVGLSPRRRWKVVRRRPGPGRITVR